MGIILILFIVIKIWDSEGCKQSRENENIAYEKWKWKWKYSINTTDGTCCIDRLTCIDTLKLQSVIFLFITMKLRWIQRRNSTDTELYYSLTRRFFFFGLFSSDIMGFKISFFSNKYKQALSTFLSSNEMYGGTESCQHGPGSAFKLSIPVSMKCFQVRQHT